MSKRIFDMAPPRSEWERFRFELTASWDSGRVWQPGELEQAREEAVERALAEYKIKVESDKVKRAVKASDIPSGVF